MDPTQPPRSRLQAIDPPELGPAVGYANGMLATTPSQLLFVAGQIGWNSTHQLVSDDLTGQFAQALDNVLAVVRAAGGASTDVARMVVYVTDKEAYRAARREIGQCWRERFGKHFPAMALVEVSGLLEPGAKVEIEATAVIS